MRRRTPVIALASAFLPTLAVACVPALRGDGVQTIEGRRVVAAWRAPAPVPLAQFFALDIAACARDGGRIESLRVDATMPQHGHGINYRPTVKPVGAGRFRAEGLLLHMPGQWQLSFAVGGETLRAALVVE